MLTEFLIQALQPAERDRRTLLRGIYITSAKCEGPAIDRLAPEIASAFGVECVPHAWGSAIGLAATVQFLAALPDQPPAFRPMPPMLEFEQTPNPLRDHLAQEPIEQKGGIVKVPTGPGLGIEIDREVLKKYKVT